MFLAPATLLPRLSVILQEDTWWQDEVTFMVAKCPAMPAPFVLDLFEDVMLKGAFREPRPELIEWGYVLRAH